MTERGTDVRKVTGVVKWFDPARGFGFVVSDEGGPDILLHANVLRNFGQSTIADAARVAIAVQQTARGVQAIELLEVQIPPSPSATLEDFQAIPPEELASAPLQAARVKWFDKVKGFGFANIFGHPEDIFIHVEVLRASGLADLQPGEALAIRVMEGRRGRMATQIFAWEAAVKEAAAE